MPQSNAQRADEDETESSGRGGNRPVATFKQGGIKVAVFPNQTQNGTMYNTTIRNSYKDDASGEWKETSSFSPTDLAVLAQLSSQAFQKITELKSQSRGR